MTRDDQTDLRKNRTYPTSNQSLCISPLNARPLCNWAPSCLYGGGRPAVLGAER